VIPDYNISGVLPPFDPANYPKMLDSVSPYRVSILEFVQKFSKTDDRKKILLGFLEYRANLRNLGIIEGFNWVDGSFLEDIEKTDKRSPRDLDLVTIFIRPNTLVDDTIWKDFSITNKDNLFGTEVKRKYSCDAYFIDLFNDTYYIIRQITYFYGLFSHQRDSMLWKGILEIAMNDDDAKAKEFLMRGGSVA
jgi:hypothetical protein